MKVLCSFFAIALAVFIFSRHHRALRFYFGVFWPNKRRRWRRRASNWIFVAAPSCLHSLNQPNKNNRALTNYAPRQPARLAPHPRFIRADDAKVYAKEITTPQWAAASPPYQGMNYAKKNYANDSASLLIVLFAAPLIFNWNEKQHAARRERNARLHLNKCTPRALS